MNEICTHKADRLKAIESTSRVGSLKVKDSSRRSRDSFASEATRVTTRLSYSSGQVPGESDCQLSPDSTQSWPLILAFHSFFQFSGQLHIRWSYSWGIRDRRYPTKMIDLWALSTSATTSGGPKKSHSSGVSDTANFLTVKFIFFAPADLTFLNSYVWKIMLLITFLHPTLQNKIFSSLDRLHGCTSLAQIKFPF